MNNATIAKVGFIGLGDQGLPIAIAIMEAGFDLHVWARRQHSLKPLSDTPCVTHDSVASLASAVDTVILCVSTDDVVDQLLREDLLPNLRTGATVINHGTGSPGKARQLHRLGQASGVSVIDAPVSGGRPGAESRKLTMFVGGSHGSVDSATPVLQACANNIVRLGGPGTGQMAKLLNNTLLALNQAAIADVLELATLIGLSPGTLMEALRLGSADSRALQLLNTMVTPDTVDHLASVEALDMEIFKDAMSEEHIDADAMTDRALSGARHLPDVMERLT